MILRYLGFLWFLVVFQPLVSGELLAAELGNLMSAEKVFSYAKGLEKAGDFNRAAHEYGRLVFFLRRHPDSFFAQKEEAFYRHGLSLANAGEADRALYAFSVFGEAFPESRRIASALLRMGQIYEEAGMVTEAKRRYQSLMARDKTFETFVRLRLSWLALQEENGVDRARYHLGQMTDPEYIEKMPTLNRALDTLTHWPRKVPRTAAVLTALLPGSGHFYLGRPRDGLFAFLSNGLLLAGTIQAFQNDISGLGVALGFIELGWYTGTIFSAVSLTHTYNRQVRAARLGKIRPLLKVEPRFLGLELNLHY